MGAMLVGMATGLMAMFFIAVEKIIIAVALFVIAHRQGMNAVKWAVAGFLLDFWTILVYIIVRIKIANLKCASCGEKVGKNAEFCPNCGERVKKIDDGEIAKKFVLYVCLIMVIIVVADVIWTMIFSWVNSVE